MFEKFLNHKYAKFLAIFIVGMVLPSCGPNKVLVKKYSEQDKDGYRICEKV